MIKENIEPENTRNDLKIESFFNDFSIDPIILDAYKYLQNTQPEILFLQDTDLTPTPDQLERYTAYHSEIYRKKAKKLSKNNWEILALGSGMYGGKSTLSFYLLDFLEEKGYKSIVSIADIMEEDSVTGRSYSGSGEVIRLAQRYGLSNQIDLYKNDISVVLLDEFSFLPFPVVEEFINHCKEKNIK